MPSIGIYRNGVCAGRMTFRILVVADLNLQPLDSDSRRCICGTHRPRALACAFSRGSRWSVRLFMVAMECFICLFAFEAHTI